MPPSKKFSSIVIIAGNSERVFANFSSLHGKVCKSITDESTSEYNKILDLTISEIDSTMRARRTRSETGYLRQKQIFINLAGYLTKRMPSEWSALAQGTLAIVVGAGPSLDITLPLLKSGIPKPLIVASDSSLRALRDANLDPDFVISIDPQKTFESDSVWLAWDGFALNLLLIKTSMM